MDRLFNPPPAGHEGPYPPEPGPGIAAHVVLARDASYWRADIEAYLVEQGMTTELAPAVIGLMNHFGGTVAEHVAALRPLLKAEWPVD